MHHSVPVAILNNLWLWEAHEKQQYVGKWEEKIAEIASYITR